ncbi:MAG TPA: CLC_0170 family protein [Oscillospiraceae bacterium]|nr:CLC_0170 family protein [Oscillospiraceae bacterium]
MINIINIIFDYIKLLFSVEIVFLFVSVGLFALIRDVPLLKKRNLKKESIILNILGYVYIFGSIILFIIIKRM